MVPEDTSAEVSVFAVRNHKDEVELHATGLSAFVNKKDGSVRFTDAGGNYITAESMPASFTPITVDGTHGYSTINSFDTQDDEGLYGLGQHQSDQWNYKGQNEELYQYNTKISIPFVISSNGYGILWDSYSQGRFGNTEPYQQLNRLFKLYDKDGNEGSLTGTYSGMRGRTQTRQEDSIYFVDSETVKNLPRLGQSVLYEGALEAPESGTYDFILYYAGYIRVFLGDEEGGAQVEVIGKADADDSGNANLSLGFMAEDLDELHAVLLRDGFAPTDFVSPMPTVRFFFVTDPAGVSVQFM
jgi:alpha-D-xyloside xylohydrolase